MDWIQKNGLEQIFCVYHAKKILNWITLKLFALITLQRKQEINPQPQSDAFGRKNMLRAIGTVEIVTRGESLRDETFDEKPQPQQPPFVKAFVLPNSQSIFFKFLTHLLQSSLKSPISQKNYTQLQTRLLLLDLRFDGSCLLSCVRVSASWRFLTCVFWLRENNIRDLGSLFEHYICWYLAFQSIYGVFSFEFQTFSGDFVFSI